MKFLNIITLFLICILLTGCEEVIDVDLNAAEPKLVVDASIKWQKGTSGNEQMIRLTTTAPYFDDTIPVVSGATVFVNDSSGNTFNFIEIPDTGEYFCDNFLPVLNASYTLTVVYHDQTFKATETLKPVPAIDVIEQTPDAGFSGEDTEIKIFFTDNATTDDFYFLTLWQQNTVLPAFQVLDDKFIQGNQSFGLFNIDEPDAGDVLNLTFAGVSEQYHNYLNILLSIAGSASGSPFQSPPVTVRGNLINQTNPDDFALGYFSLSEIEVREIVIAQ